MMLYKRCVTSVGRLSSNTLEIKQLTGIESCQCRKGRIQINHIACAMLVWLRLKHKAYQTGQTVYQLKHRLLSDYLIQQLKRPSLAMILAKLLLMRSHVTVA
ncbi:hypothetical protein MiSe_42890 [Microseira wollei NIES-4236]|uniref:Transposase n=1 Tax=Microseira wollei NIES-4236 TaxID=2530354 RepID=A0AAV3WIQ9_9CYAN|nr:hypothetical protein MiSe_42890 [Microseira wollei NIES-4236]